MIRVNYREQLFNFFVFVGFQLLLLNKLVLFDSAFAFFYIAFLLFLPRLLGRPLQLLIAFLVGLLVDVFSSTPGMNASACVMMAFMRNFWLNTIYSDDEDQSSINAYNFGFIKFISFLFPLVFIHHLVLFTVENGGLTRVLPLAFKILSSSIFTTVMITIFSYLTSSRGRQV